MTNPEKESPVSHYITNYARNPANSSARRSVIFLFGLMFFAVYFVALSPFLFSSFSFRNEEFAAFLKSPKYLYIVEFSFSIIEHLVPMLAAGCFGLLGGIVRTFIGRDLTFYAEVENFVRNKISVSNDGQVPVGLIKLRQEQDHLVVAAIMGIISYAIIKSNVLLKLIYPKISVADNEINFISVIFAGFFFGLFSKTLVGFSDKYADRISIQDLQRQKRDTNSVKGDPQ
jgi:hypothetical protein